MTRLIPKSARAATVQSPSLSERQLLARHEAVLNSTLDPIITIDAHGTIVSVSKSIQRTFGYAPEELLGRNVSVLMPSPHRDAHDGYLARYRETGVTNILGRTREFEAQRKDGSKLPVEIAVARVDVPGEEMPLFTGIIHDISERKAIETERTRVRDDLETVVRERSAELLKSHEQLRQADRLASIGTLAAGLGHDMNNVLLPMRCRLDAVEAMDLSDAGREELAIVRRLCNYLQQLSDGLHLLALDPEDSEASEPTTNLTEWWEQVGVLFLKALPRHAQFESDIEADLPEVAVEPHRLTQAVLNLVVNAGEAIGPNGTVKFWARRDANSGRLHVGVTDNGCGMTRQVQRRAFDPFYTTKTRGLGTGMGLSFVRGVAQSAGGQVAIDSEPGRGTTIQLELPFAAAIAPRGRGERTARLALSDGRLSAVMETMLRADGFEVSTGAPGQPEGGSIWIVEPVEANLHEAAAYLRERPERQIIVCGPSSMAWLRLEVFHIDQVDDFDAVRQTLRLAIAAYEGA